MASNRKYGPELNCELSVIDNRPGQMPTTCQPDSSDKNDDLVFLSPEEEPGNDLGGLAAAKEVEQEAEIRYVLTEHVERIGLKKEKDQPRTNYKKHAQTPQDPTGGTGRSRPNHGEPGAALIRRLKHGNLDRGPLVRHGGKAGVED